MKKITSLFLAVIMLLTLLFAVPFTTQAAGEVDCTEVVYKVTNYSELAEAFADSEHDRTIILQNHIFENAVSSQRDIYVKGSKTVVFDMNGYDITLHSTRTESMFYIKESPKVHFMNSDKENSSEIYFNVQQNPATPHASILYFNAAVDAEFYSYNINYYVGSEDLYDYSVDAGYQANYIQSMEDVDVLNIQEMGSIYLLGGKFVNYYAYGSGVYAAKNSICYGLYLRGADFETGYSCLFYDAGSTVLTKITEGKFYRIDTGMVSRVIYTYGIDTKISEVTGKNLMDNTPTVVEDMQGMEISGNALVNDIDYNLEFTTEGSGQDHVDNSFITPNGHILIYYESGGFSGVMGHRITEVGGFDATCTVEGKEPNKICSLCNYVQEEGKEIPVTEHTVVTKNAKKATCFAKGYTGDEVCSQCDTLIKKGKATAKLTLKAPKVKYTGGKKKFTVKYTKVKNSTGFQVKYKIGKKSVTETYKTKKNVSKVIKDLKKGTYKVQCCAFIKKGNKTAYGKWTKGKTVKVK